MIESKPFITTIIVLISLYAHSAKAEGGWHKTTCADHNNSGRPACVFIDDQEVRNKLVPDPKKIDSAKIVFAFGGDGCMASSPVYLSIDKDKKQSKIFTANTGIALENDMRAQCAYKDQLDRAYILYRDVSFEKYPNYTLRIFAIYAVKDQVGDFITPLTYDDGTLNGHRHEWEHAAIWLKNGLPLYVSVTHHKDLISKPAAEVPNLAGHNNWFAVKYIRGTIPIPHPFDCNIPFPKGIASHYPDFAAGDEENGELIARNKNPTPSGQWFGESDNDYIDYDSTDNDFRKIIDNRKNWGSTVPRINDINYFLSHKPPGWHGPSKI